MGAGTKGFCTTSSRDICLDICFLCSCSSLLGYAVMRYSFREIVVGRSHKIWLGVMCIKLRVNLFYKIFVTIFKNKIFFLYRVPSQPLWWWSSGSGWTVSLANVGRMFLPLLAPNILFFSSTLWVSLVFLCHGPKNYSVSLALKLSLPPLFPYHDEGTC